MDKVYIGKIVSTHGIKGEVKIKSSFQYKDKVFKVGNYLLIDDKEYVIRSYRVHKGFDMVTLNDYNGINQILFLMKKNVYFDYSRLNLSDNEVLDSDLINYKVLTNDGKEGIIKEIFFASEKNKIMRVFIDKEYLIPFNSPMIKEVSKKENYVLIELIDGM